MISNIMDQIRECSEECSNLQGFIITHSSEGGTGSGLTSRILSDLYVNYGKKTKCEICVCPSFNQSVATQNKYNPMLLLKRWGTSKFKSFH